jgi:hypothetical protein
VDLKLSWWRLWGVQSFVCGNLPQSSSAPRTSKTGPFQGHHKHSLERPPPSQSARRLAAPVSIRLLLAGRQGIRGGHAEREDSTLTSDKRSKEYQPQDKESQRAAYRQHRPDRLRSATQLSPVYASGAPAWLSRLQPASSTAVFVLPCHDPFQGQQRPTVCAA